MKASSRSSATALCLRGCSKDSRHSSSQVLALLCAQLWSPSTFSEPCWLPCATIWSLDPWLPPPHAHIPGEFPVYFRQGSCLLPPPPSRDSVGLKNCRGGRGGTFYYQSLSYPTDLTVCSIPRPTGQVHTDIPDRREPKWRGHLPILKSGQVLLFLCKIWKSIENKGKSSHFSISYTWSESDCGAEAPCCFALPPVRTPAPDLLLGLCHWHIHLLHSLPLVPSFLNHRVCSLGLSPCSLCSNNIGQAMPNRNIPQKQINYDFKMIAVYFLKIPWHVITFENVLNGVSYILESISHSILCSWSWDQKNWRGKKKPMFSRAPRYFMNNSFTVLTDTKKSAS